MKNRIFSGLLATLLMVFHFNAFAEDVDLFAGYTPTSRDAPNVLIIVDNTANWNQAFANEMAALASTLEGLPENKFRVGIMFAAETGKNNNNVDGGYVRAAIRLMDSPSKPLYRDLVLSFDKLKDKGNGGTSALVMAEAYRYLKGGVPYAGNGKEKTDYTGNSVTGYPASNAVYALTGNALASKSSDRYISPVASGCQKNFIIYISNGPDQMNNAGIKQAESMLTAAGGTITQIPVSPSGSQENPIDEWARFLRKSELGVITYTIDIDPPSTGQGPGWTAVLKSMARISSGKYFTTGSATAGGIANALKTIFSEIQSVDSVFASVSLPVSVNTQGTYLNQVYVGMFRPDADSFPRWNGNLKMYKLGYVNNVLKLLDADNSSAINTATGFITECARSYWTPTTTDTYWSFRPGGACLAVQNSDLSNYPDGNVVEKGAQAYKLRSMTGRTVKTCVPGSCVSLIDFSADNVTQDMLGALSTAEQSALVDWTKGKDNSDENGNTNLTEMRPSMHGDIVHSRPIALNYGTDAAPQVVVYYGGNDGLLRAINGNRSGTIGGYAAGEELWSFMPPEFYPHIKRLRDNTIPLQYFGSDNSVTRLPKPYGMDGPVTAFRDTSHTWIYATMRRGGRAFYAFDVTTPTSPSLKWRRGCPNQSNDTGCDTGFDGIGQTWSSLKPLKAAGYINAATGSAKPMVIAGGGYDICEDVDASTASTCASPKGNKIFVIDADNGELLKTLDTDRSVVGDVMVVEDNAGLAKYAYAADTGGNLYRITIGTAAPSAWTIVKIASLGCDTTEACAPNRKFLFGPDIVEDGGTYILPLGSGDREKPLMGNTSPAQVNNHFFMIKDKPSDATWLTSQAPTCNAHVICKASLFDVDDTQIDAATKAAKKGWYLNLRSREQVVTSAITVYGTVTFSTHQPSSNLDTNTCANLGIASVYNIDYRDAKPLDNATSRYDNVQGGGLPPSPIAGMVTLDSGKTVPFVIGAKPWSLEGAEPPMPGLTSRPKSKVYWYIRQ